MKQTGAHDTEDHDQTGSVAKPPVSPSQDHDAEGDFGGPFFYGHPAHKPDPSAIDTFSAGAIRPLPVDSKQRWR
jgi:hypothetical protein